MLSEVILSLQRPKARNARIWTGHKFDTGSIVLGYLYSKYIGKKRKVKKGFWLVRCVCGFEQVRESGEIRSNKVELCSTCKCKKKRKIQIGDIFGNGCKLIKELEEIIVYNRYVRIFLYKCHCSKISKIRSTNIKRINECRVCVGKTLGKNIIGVNHHNWNHKLSSEERLKLKNNRKLDYEYSKFREVVYKRDNYTCVLSGKSDNLNCHHLDGWHWCKEKRYDLNNAISLNKDLHNLFHSIYGRKNNTKEQFEEFKQKYKNGLGI